MKKFNVWCNKVVSVEMEVVCKDENELWDIMKYDVYFQNYGGDGDLIGINNNNSNVNLTYFSPDTDTDWYIHDVRECDEDEYQEYGYEEYEDECEEDEYEEDEYEEDEYEED